TKILLTVRSSPQADLSPRSPVTGAVQRRSTRSSGEQCPALNSPAKNLNCGTGSGVQGCSLEFSKRHDSAQNLRGRKRIHVLDNRKYPSDRGAILAKRNCPMSRRQRATQTQT